MSGGGACNHVWRAYKLQRGKGLDLRHLESRGLDADFPMLEVRSGGAGDPAVEAAPLEALEDQGGGDDSDVESLSSGDSGDSDEIW